MIDELKAQIKVVARARQRAQEAFEAKVVSQAEWERRNKAIIDIAVATNQEVNDEEIKLRELTLQIYAQTGNKTPAPGVGIREMTRLEYDKEVAFTWAVEHTMALKLDVLAFEKVAKASPLDFVKVFQQPQATIARVLEV